MAKGLLCSPSPASRLPRVLWEPACRRMEGKALPCNPQPFLTLNQAAYSAGKNSKVNAVATINPPMIATAIGP